MGGLEEKHSERFHCFKGGGRKASKDTQGVMKAASYRVQFIIYDRLDPIRGER